MLSQRVLASFMAGAIVAYTLCTSWRMQSNSGGHSRDVQSGMRIDFGQVHISKGLWRPRASSWRKRSAGIEPARKSGVFVYIGSDVDIWSLNFLEPWETHAIFAGASNILYFIARAQASTRVCTLERVHPRMHGTERVGRGRCTARHGTARHGTACRLVPLDGAAGG